MTTQTLEILQRWLWWVTIAGHAVLVLRIWASRLHRTYRWFFGYLILRVARGVLLLGVPAVVQALNGRPNIPFGTRAYGWTWMITQPVLWVFYVLVVLELYSLVLKDHKGIATFSRWALWTALTISLTLSSISLAPDLGSSARLLPVIRYFNVIDRGIASSLVLFLLFLAGFLAWYPVPLSRNVVVHSIVYAVYFLSTTLALLGLNLLGVEVMQVVNVLLSAIMLLCLGVWIAFLNRQGETKTVVVGHRWVAGEEEQLIQQLTSINTTLLRAVRK